MAQDNHVSSFLLLLLIAAAIYFLLYPDGFKNINKKEFFEQNMDLSEENVDLSHVDPELMKHIIEQTSSNEAPIISQVPVVQQSSMVNSQVINSIINSPNEEPNMTLPPVPVMQQNNMPIVSSNPVVPDTVLSEIINEDIQSAPVPATNKQTLFEPKNQQTQQNQQNILKTMDNAVINFDANDQSYDPTGTDLGSAFMSPLPPGSHPDAVDFKKNNVDNYNTKDFLPQQINDEWFETDFSLAKYQLNDDKLINTEKYIIGINTVGQSLKNASYDIRGTIANPKFIVSPWNQSTYEPDFNLKPLC